MEHKFIRLDTVYGPKTLLVVAERGNCYTVPDPFISGSFITERMDSEDILDVWIQEQADIDFELEGS